MVDGFSCILDFSKFFGGGPPDPPYKGNTSIKPSKSFFKIFLTKHLLHYYQSLSHNLIRNWVLVEEKGYYFDRLSFNRWLKLFNCQIFSRLAFGIKGCSSKTRFISSIFRLLCPALWHYVREHIIYSVYLDCVLVFAFAFLSCKTKSALNRTFSTESYRNWRKSVKILKNNGLLAHLSR